MIPSGARVWIAMGHTDMRKGRQGPALIVQQVLGSKEPSQEFSFTAPTRRPRPDGIR